MRVLLVEDDPHLRETVSTGFREQHIETVCAATFAEGRERSALSSYAVIVLDVMLPGGDGFALCERIRGRGDATPS